MRPASILAVALAVGLPARAPAQPGMALGWHGGYYLTDQQGHREALDRLGALLAGAPDCRVALEFEPYTLERMAGARLLGVERACTAPTPMAGWTGGSPGDASVDVLPAAAHSGQAGARLTLRSGDYVQVIENVDAAGLAGKALRFRAWVRARSGRTALYVDAHRGGTLIPGSGVESAVAPNDGAWHMLELTCRVPDGAQILFPQCRVMAGPGDADVDDLSLTPLPEGRELLRNGGLESGGPDLLADPSRLAMLRRYVGAGRLEPVGGIYTQPILYTVGQESVMRQFALGCRATRDALGAPVRVYAAQEPCWVGQMPQILDQFGYTGALFRTNWQPFGAAPARNADLVWWRGPDGTRIRTIPMPAAMRSGWGLQPATVSLVERLALAGSRHPYFLDLGDFVASWIPGADDPRAQGRALAGLAHVCRTVPAAGAAGKDVMFAGWLRSTAPGAHLYVDAYAGAVNLGGAETQPIAPDGIWHRCELRWRVPAGADRLYPQARVYIARETGWVDAAGLGLSVLPAGPALTPDFNESRAAGWTVAGLSGASAHGTVQPDGPPGVRGSLRVSYTSQAVACRPETPSEYLRRVGDPTSVWTDAYAAFEHRYPWGIMAGYHLRADREMERRLLALERQDAMDCATGQRPGAARPPLADLWRLLLIGQHHDPWVCGPLPAFGIWSRDRSMQRYSDITVACAREASALWHEPGADLAKPGRGQPTVENRSGVRLHPRVAVAWRLPRGQCRRPLVVDQAGRVVPASVTVGSRHPDGSAAEVSARVLADVSALGRQGLRVVEANGRKQPPIPPVAVERAAGRIRIDNGLCGVEVTKAGVQVYRAGRPVLREPAHLAGAFPGGEERSVFDTVTVEADPGGAATVRATGHIASVRLRLEATVEAGSPSAQLSVTCDFGAGTAVGEGPERMPEQATWSHDERKLRWVFPLAWPEPRFRAHGAFEMREPGRATWPVLDVATADGPGEGLALYPDRATAGVFERSPASLGIVLAFGGSFIYAPGGRSLLTGSESFRLGMYPYGGSAEKAMVVQRAEAALPGPQMRPARTTAAVGSPLVSLAPESAAALSACWTDGRDTVVRLWRPYEGPATVKLNVPGARSLWLASPTGERKQRLSSSGTASVRIRSQEIVTVRACR